MGGDEVGDGLPGGGGGEEFVEEVAEVEERGLVGGRRLIHGLGVEELDCGVEGGGVDGGHVERWMICDDGFVG